MSYVITSCSGIMSTSCECGIASSIPAVGVPISILITSETNEYWAALNASHGLEDYSKLKTDGSRPGEGNTVYHF